MNLIGRRARVRDGRRLALPRRERRRARSRRRCSACQSCEHEIAGGGEVKLGLRPEHFRLGAARRRRAVSPAACGSSSRSARISTSPSRPEARSVQVRTDPDVAAAAGRERHAPLRRLARARVRRETVTTSAATPVASSPRRAVAARPSADDRPRAAVVEAVEASQDGAAGPAARARRLPHREPGEGGDALPGRGAALHRFVGDFLSGLGFELDGWDVGPSATFPAHPLLVARLPGSGGGRSLAFNAHVDVVPVGDRSSWSQDPFGGAIVDGRLYGRGATDMKGGLAAAMWATKVDARARASSRAGTSSSTSSATRRSSETARARSSSAHLPATSRSRVEPSELRLCAAEGGLVHFRIEVEGVEAHASTRYLSRPRRRQGRRRRQRDREDAQARRCAPGAGAAVGEHEVAPDPAARLRHALAGDHRGRPRRRLRRPAQPLLERRARRRTTARSNTTCGGTPTSRTTTCAPRSRRSSTRSPAPTRGCASTRRGSPGSSGRIYFPPLDVPLDHPAVQHARRLPRERRPRPGAAGIRRRDRPRLVRGAASCPGSFAGPDASPSATSPTSTSRRSSSPLAAQGVRADARRVVRVAAAAMRALVYTLERTLDVLDVETPVPDAGEVLIRVERVGICGSDVQGVATRSPRRAPPLIMGHELIGEVTAAAPGVGGARRPPSDGEPAGPLQSLPPLPLRVREHLPAPRARRREPPGRLRRVRRGAGDAAST